MDLTARQHGLNVVEMNGLSSTSIVLATVVVQQTTLHDWARPGHVG